MRIPLDYYRILGLPIQATVEQLKQAHRDRTLQLPRREYSAIAIESRKSLLDEAYALLSDEDQRRNYDAQFLARAYATEAAIDDATPDALTTEIGEEALRALASEPTTPSPEAYTPTVEINPTQLVGALLILLELGEYELVIRLGRPYLSSGSASVADGRYGDPKRVLEDIVLTLALACLELGREQWQQRQYESAAESLETGQELLLRENVFPAIRAELQADLYKLRPYRILELVARPLEQTPERRQGIKLLKGMLQDRGGIDGAEDDLSGLNTDDFLRFIQQLRSYLTAGEQQEIFEGEARRPSAVATYLAVYALLARGFAFHQPALVRRAKQLLRQIGTQQDVHLEQAVCALLLGQTEEASRALELSQEYEPLAFIREHSQHSPDLLPGLCLYAERWLREEVFPHFRDLSQQHTALKDYFADPQVQAYLEAMPPKGTSDVPFSPIASVAASEAAAPMSPLRDEPVTAGSPPLMGVPLGAEVAAGRRSRSTPLPRRPEEVVEPSSGPSVAERVSQLSPEGRLEGGGQQRNGHRRPSRLEPPLSGVGDLANGGTDAQPRRRSRSPRWGRLVGVILLGIFGMGILGFGTMRILAWVTGQLGGPNIKKPALDIGLAAPPIAIPTPPPPEATITTQDIAQRAIEGWLAAKREALGDDHNAASLEAVLVDPALTKWQNLSRGAERENWYWNYEHTVEVLTVEPDDPTSETLIVKARVKEVGQYYELGQLNERRSYDDTLTMRYDLVRQNGEWFVRDMQAVE
ncbi:MAG: DUF4101 domain-containing protein [Leptolyngbyaceae cyanobacterium T60_A2020_046]|nr:DUF4101 domain-containing protein [Leptolyngbyaceae cyanobacterium T60_A2020_046]